MIAKFGSKPRTLKNHRVRHPQGADIKSQYYKEKSTGLKTRRYKGGVVRDANLRAKPQGLKTRPALQLTAGFEDFQEAAEGFAAMAVQVFFVGGQFGEGFPERRIEEHRVVAEAGGAARFL